jgi:mannosyl-glycoprotein endo-beta-N-acetylglucosaminidase
VIYYDSLDKDGRASHQNALISHNKVFFEACDGIFLNYQWFDYGTVQRSKAEAGHRHFDVYAGVDVWARNCQYGVYISLPVRGRD